jgi:hypothetical protein
VPTVVETFDVVFCFVSRGRQARNVVYRFAHHIEELARKPMAIHFISALPFGMGLLKEASDDLPG